MIEARIVEASELFNRNLGARLGINSVNGTNGFRAPLQSPGGTTRYAFGTGGPGNVDAGAVGGVQGLTTTQTDGLGVNLPAAGLNSFNAGAFSFILFNQGLTKFLNLEISALEADGKGKIDLQPARADRGPGRGADRAGHGDSVPAGDVLRRNLRVVHQGQPRRSR